MKLDNGLHLTDTHIWTEGSIDTMCNIKLNAVLNGISYVRNKAKGKKYELIFFNSQPFVSFAIRLTKVEQKYYEQIIIDKLLESLLESFSTSEREGYKLFQFTDRILEVLTENFSESYSLSPPLYRDFISDRVDSYFKGKFYGKYTRDCFGHKTLIVRNEGIDKCFAYTTATGVSHQPFWLLQDEPFISEFPMGGRKLTMDKWFHSNKTTFAHVWERIKAEAEAVVQRKIRI